MLFKNSIIGVQIESETPINITDIHKESGTASSPFIDRIIISSITKTIVRAIEVRT